MANDFVLNPLIVTNIQGAINSTITDNIQRLTNGRNMKDVIITG